MRQLLSLCDYSGAWSAPFVGLGWHVTRIDIAYPEGIWVAVDGVHKIGDDIRNWHPTIGKTYDGILAAPPCTCFCRPSARWWGRQDSNGQTAHDIEVMRRCLEICQMSAGWWAMENPPGRHEKLIPELGRPSWQWQPFEYGDPWYKQTYIWGTAKKPAPTKVVQPPPTRRTPNGKTQGRIAFMSSSWKREREKTPAGFAQAFAATNG